MKTLILLVFLLCSGASLVHAQAEKPSEAAKETIQPSQTAPRGNTQPEQKLQTARELKIPANTPIEVEVAYTVNSRFVRVGELLSFRVLVPIQIDGVTAIERDALVTARVTRAKRGGHWGKGGRLNWTMEDVIAVNNARIPLAPQTRLSAKDWVLAKHPKEGVKGTSHGTEVATRTVIAAAIFPPLAPLALMNGFRRGEDAILPEGKRFVVVVRDDTVVTVNSTDKLQEP